LRDIAVITPMSNTKINTPAQIAKFRASAFPSFNLVRKSLTIDIAQPLEDRAGRYCLCHEGQMM
jgi:hypothetical protein